MRILPALMLSVAVGVFLGGCSREQPSATQGEPKVAQLASPAPPMVQAFDTTLPAIKGPQSYVGSSACQKCHEDQYNSWHRSYHRTMTQVASETSVQADFDNVVLTTEQARFTLNKTNGQFWVRMEPLVLPPVEAGPAPVLDQRLGLVTGSHHMQVFWVPEGSGNLQLGFPFTWLIPEKRWVPRNSTFVRPPHLPHNAELWNVVCSRCHTTAPEPHVDFSARTAHTEVAELGISCEACHGPGQTHVQAQKAALSESKTVAPGEIVQPKKLSAERSSQVCGFCHSMKWMDQTHDWRQNGFQFRPGDDLEQTTPIIRPSHVDSIPGLKDYLARHPDILEDFFWPDGMVRVSGREFNGVLESPCYKGGKFSCLSCHSLHESEPDDQLSARGQSNLACTQCHEPFQDNARLTAHTHHTAESSGSDCYNCHMPHTTYGILKAIRSHEISSPSIASELATGRPNACNLCHLDKTLAWTQSYLGEWYGETSDLNPSTPGGYSQVATLALSGDAGQRVLAAWALSWEPARKTSRVDWVAPILGTLLDDPYAAVRCVAERSLRQVSPAAIPSDYDYTLDPANRPSAREKVWQTWKPATSTNSHASEVLLHPDGSINTEAVAALLRERKEAPVRLRE